MANEFIARNGITSLGNIVVSGSITTTGTVVISGSIASSSFAATASSADNFLTRGTLTAQTLIVQTVTSSVDFVTGSTRFGSILGNTHVFSGSVTMNPNGLFVSSSGIVGIGTTTPTSLLEVQANQNTQTGIRVRNSTSGTGATVEFGAYTNSGNAGFGKYSTGTNAYKNILAGSTFVYNGASGDIALLNDASSGNISFAAGAVSTAQMYISASGNVGIGTTNPTSKLSVSGTIESLTDAAGEGGQFLLRGNTYQYVIDNYNGNSLRFNRENDGTGASGVTLMSINSSGSVSIIDSITIAKAKVGTGVESFNLLTLQLTGTGAIGDNANIRFTSAQGGYTIANISGIAGADNVAYGSLAFSTRNYNTDSVVEVMRIGNRGNVGIGTTTPNSAYKLDVSGDIRATGTIYANANGTMYFRGGDDAGLYDVNIANTMGIYGVQDSTIGTIKLGSGGGTLSGYSGRIGVNVTTPDNALHVTDTGNDTVMKLGGGGAARDTNFTMYSQSAGNTVQAIHYNGNMAFYSNKFNIASNGNASLVGSLTQNTSDIRLKTNINIIQNAIDKIKQLSGFTYNWNALANELGGFNTTIKEVGVAAQSVKEVVPEAVFSAPFDNGFDPSTQSFYSKSGENYLTVQYEKLVPLLIEGIKELTARVQELENK